MGWKRSQKSLFVLFVLIGVAFLLEMAHWYLYIGRTRNLLSPEDWAENPYVGLSQDQLKGGMVEIEAGDFYQGCLPEDTNCRPDEKPGRMVYLDTFWIDRHEVTVDAYLKCVEAGACDAPANKGGCNSGIRQVFRQGHRRDLPVNCINWYDADSYCRWVDKRLLTEAEWEKAARGGRMSLYPWGETAPTCDYVVRDQGGLGCGRHQMWPVCSKPHGHTADGLCDMIGNAWEWVEDWYEPEYYATMPNRNPGAFAETESSFVNSEGDSLKNLRGQSYYSGKRQFPDPDGFRISFRDYGHYPHFKALKFGIRCGRSQAPTGGE